MSNKFAIGVLLGTVAYFHPLFWYFIVPLLLVGVYRYKPIAIILMLAALCGLVNTFAQQHVRQHWQLPQPLESKDVTVTGHIASIPIKKGRADGFMFAMKTFNHRAATATLKLNWYGRHAKLTVGDAWQLSLRLKRPHGLSNPGGFDYKAWLLQQGIAATGYVRKSRNNQRLSHHWYHYPIDRARSALLQDLQPHLSNLTFGNLLLAMTLGIRQGMSAPQWQVLRATGTSHLMAISGLHVGMIAGGMYFLAAWLWRCSSLCCSWLPAPKFAALAAVLSALSYGAMAGFAVPTQRACIMIVTLMWGQLAQRHIPFRQSYLLALLLVLLWDPFSVQSVGFWLSFGAVAVIAYGMQGRLNPRNLWWRFGRVQWIIALGLAPLSILFFQQVSLIAPIANIIAVPWVGLLVVPCSLLAVMITSLWPWAGGQLLKVANLLMKPIWVYLTYLSQQPLAMWHIASANNWVMLLAILGVVIILLPRGVPGRYLGILLCLPLLLLKPKQPQLGEFWLTVLDVGQGLAVVVQTQHHSLVYDVGAKDSDQFDMGRAVVVPYLLHQGIKHLDSLVVSHGDNDHVGGAESLLCFYPAKHIYLGEPMKQIKQSYRLCQQGQSWVWDGVKFEFLFPPKERGYSGNDSSCVLKISTGKHHALLTGDIERKAEAYLLQRQRSMLAAQILVVPHHGSNTSSSLRFVQAVAPQYALMSTGYLNRYKLPSAKVLSRYHNAAVDVIDTSKRGAIVFAVSPKGVRRFTT